MEDNYEYQEFELDTGEVINARVLKNGALLNPDTGKIVAPPTPNNWEGKPELARAAINKRWQAHHDKRQEGIIEAVREDGGDVLDIMEADSYVTKVLTKEVLLSNETPGRDRIMAYWKLWQNAGLVPDKNTVDMNISGQVAVIDAEAVIAKLFAEKYNGDADKVIEALQQFRQGTWKP